MRRLLPTLLLAMTLLSPVDALTAAKSPKLAKCDGRQRRPANPYGSILPTVDPQAGMSTPATQASERSGVDIFSDTPSVPPTPAKPGAQPQQIPPISSATPPTPDGSC